MVNIKSTLGQQVLPQNSKHALIHTNILLSNPKVRVWGDTLFSWLFIFENFTLNGFSFSVHLNVIFWSKIRTSSPYRKIFGENCFVFKLSHPKHLSLTSPCWWSTSLFTFHKTKHLCGSLWLYSDRCLGRDSLTTKRFSPNIFSYSEEVAIIVQKMILGCV